MNQQKIFSFLVILFLFQACNKTTNCPDDVYINDSEIIDEYHKHYFPRYTASEVNQDFSIYLDYSSGMKIAFSDENSKKMYELFINSLKISQVDLYEVSKGEINPIKNLEKSALYEKVKNHELFVNNYAPLDKAVDQIVKKNAESVFITDGELYDRELGERDDPWAREAFGKWLKAGNTIEFFITNFIEGGKQKHVFFMFFIPNHKAYENKGIANDFKYYLENSLEAKKITYEHLSFSNSDFNLIQDYETEKSGGANPNAGLDETNYINKGDELHFEYHEYMTDWDDMRKYIFNISDDMGNPKKGGDPLISKLYFEQNSLEFFDIKELGLKVYDARRDFNRLKKMKECQMNPPTYLRDENGKKILDEQNKPIVECPGQYECYDEGGNLIVRDTVFEPKQTLPPAKEIYTFDKESFNNNMAEQERGEIIIKLHPNFDGTQLLPKIENLHRLDIYIKKVETITGQKGMENFIWEGKKIPVNKSMYNSVLGALNESNPENKVIYTFYIKTQPYY